MRSDVRSLVVLVAFAAMTLPAAGGQTLSNGLTSAQAQRLHRLGYAVVPNPAPRGFHVTTVTTAPDNGSYRVVYVRSNDGASLTIVGRRGAGAPGGTAASTPAPKKRGFLANLGSALGGLGKKASGQQSSGTSSESEEPLRDTGSIADSRLIGPAHFASDGACLKGVADTSKALIRNASFTVQACNFEKSEPVYSAYRSVSRV